MTANTKKLMREGATFVIDYKNRLNSTLMSVKPSGIRKFFDIANELDDVISLSVGEPDFHTPWHIREEGIYSLEKGRTRYTPNRGFAKLREEIAKFRRESITSIITRQRMFLSLSVALKPLTFASVPL